MVRSRRRVFGVGVGSRSAGFGVASRDPAGPNDFQSEVVSIETGDAEIDMQIIAATPSSK